MPPLHRAYGLLHIKSVDDARRIIRGTASTPEPDRMGDIIEPLGIQYKNPLPLLLYHNAQKPVGTVTFSPPTANGLDFEAEIATVDEPGTVHDRVEEAWTSVKAGLLAGVSIGFRSIEEAYNKATNGFRFTKSEVLELSLVAIPANPGATIQSIKALDLAASGRTLPGVTGLPLVRAEKAAQRMTTQTTTEQITAFENTRAAKAARMTDLMQAAADAHVTLDAAQTDEYDGLEAELRSIDAHLVRLRVLETTQLAHATAITARTPAEASAQRGSVPVITVKAAVPPGTAFVRYCQAIAVSKGSRLEAVEYAKQQASWKESTPEVELVLRAAVAAGTTTDATWAGPLVPMKALTSEFLDLLRPAYLLGRIPGLRMVPFNISIASQTGGGTYQWVGQGAPKPVGKLAFATVTLGMTKCAGIIVITAELARSSTPSAEDTIRNDMIKGIAAFLDVQFTDPTLAPVANVSPGSITNGVTPLTSAGNTPANARTDLQALLGAMTANNYSAANTVVLMSESNALALGFALNPLGQPLFPSLGAQGGTALGVPIIASKSAGNNVIALDPSSILLADDGGVTIDASQEASVQMDSAPDNPGVATTVLTSFWQQNLVGLRAERFINWKKARPNCVQYLVATYSA